MVTITLTINAFVYIEMLDNFLIGLMMITTIIHLGFSSGWGESQWLAKSPDQNQIENLLWEFKKMAHEKDPATIWEN